MAREQQPKRQRTRSRSVRAGHSRTLLIRLAAAGVIAVAVVVALILNSGSHAAASVYFRIIAPANGATVSSLVQLKVALHGAKIGDPSTGLDHLHISLDGSEPIADYSSPTVTLPPIPPGHHTLTVQLAGPDHAPLLSDQSVSVTVR